MAPAELRGRNKARREQSRGWVHAHPARARQYAHFVDVQIQRAYAKLVQPTGLSSALMSG